MAQLKIARNERSVRDFLDSIEGEGRRRDAYHILDLMRTITRATPEMWGDSIGGFGSYRYRYASGREGEASLASLPPGSPACISTSSRISISIP